MKRFLNPDSPLMQKMAYLFDLVALSALFTVCSLPIVTIGAAAAALLETVRQRMDQEDVTPITYFQNMRRTWKTATALWLVLLASGGILFLDFRITEHMPGAGRFFMVILLCLLAVCLLLILVSGFAFVCREGKHPLGRVLVQAFLTSVAQLPRAALLLAAMLLPLLTLLVSPKIGLAAGFLWLFLWPAVVAWLNVRLLL